MNVFRLVTLPFSEKHTSHIAQHAQKGAARMRRSVLASIALVSTFALAACGSGAGSSFAPHTSPTDPLAGAVRTTATFTVAVPAAKQTTASAGRSAKYVSSATQSVVFSLTNYNGTTLSSPINTVVALTGANCIGSGTSKVCTVTSSEPIGTDTFAISTYASAGGTGTPLSTTVKVANIASGANSVAATLNPVVSSLAWSPTAWTTPAGSATYQATTLNALDASGATIIGPGNYAQAGGSADLISVVCGSELTPKDSGGSNTTFTNMSAPSLNNIGRLNYDGSGSTGTTQTCVATDTAANTATFTFTLASTASVTWTLN